MHPDLAPHLHTDECNALIAQFHACHKENPFKKFLGACNDIDRQMGKCLVKEREANRKNNKNKLKKYIPEATEKQ